MHFSKQVATILSQHAGSLAPQELGPVASVIWHRSTSLNGSRALIEKVDTVFHFLFGDPQAFGNIVRRRHVCLLRDQSFGSSELKAFLVSHGVAGASCDVTVAMK